MPPFTIVRSNTHLEIELLRLGQVDVTFASEADEDKYQRLDLALAEQIEAQVVSLFPTLNPSELVYTNLDWWPSKARSVVLSKSAFCAAAIERLSALLHGEYSDWKIHVHVCKALGVNSDDSEIGTLCVLPNRIIIESGLHAALSGTA